MTIYKILHVATGLYYKPTNGNRCNLTKRGKLYIHKPDVVKSYYHTDNVLRETLHGEFKIKEIKLEVKEVG